MTRRVPTRRSTTSSQQAKTEQEPEEIPEPPPAAEDPPADTPSSSARPRRVVKKNTLYHNEDYDLKLPAKGRDSSTPALESRARSSTPKVTKPRAKSRTAIVKPTETEQQEEPLEEELPEVSEPAQSEPATHSRRASSRRAPPKRAVQIVPKQEADDQEAEEAVQSRPESGALELEEHGTVDEHSNQEPEVEEKPAPAPPSRRERAARKTPLPVAIKRAISRPGSLRAPPRKRRGLGNQEEEEMGQEEHHNEGVDLTNIVPKTEEGRGQEEDVDAAPKLDDIVYADGADLVVGCDVEVALEDDGPPVLGANVTKDDEGADNADDEDYSSEDGETSPPNLEKQQINKRRGRPRHTKAEREQAVKMKFTRPPQKFVRAQPVDRAKAAASCNRRNIKLFENELETTPQGDCYATVISGCLAELLRKDRILDLLTNPEEVEMIRQGGWMLDRQPRLPPLTSAKVCYAFYVDGSKVTNPKDLSLDDLRPWSATYESMGSHGSVKPNVRRHPISRQNGKLTPCKVDPRLAELHLTEYSARLPRDQRLRKKIFYLSRENMLYGNVLILYDYTTVGPAPQVISAPHGNDLLRGAVMEDVVSLQDNGSPFENVLMEGSQGGIYLKLKPNKLGWVHNKNQLIDVLVNKPEILNEMDALNNCLPFLPPLIDTAGVFVYFVPAHQVINQIHHATDGFSPWTTNPTSVTDGISSPRVRSSRRALERTADGRITMARDSRMQTDFCLVETMSTLARCRRIRKRVLYVQQATAAVLGNVCYIYEYLTDGPIPELLTNVDPKIYNKWPPRVGMSKKKQAMLAMEEEMLQNQLMYEDEIGMELVEEEIIGNVMVEDSPHVHQQMQENMIIEEDMEDCLNGGYDDEFVDDILDKADNPAPYYDQARELNSGHVYLTVRHKKVASSFDTVLEWIANTNTVEERGILNSLKPGHPPIVSNARAYAFFVAGSAIFPHDVNRDDFSPWSHNGNADNPTCYRTKVRKLGVGCEMQSNTFHIREADYKLCAFHLVFLYSINPRDPRLRKKIFYLMETESKMIVSHALIIYDYNSEGPLPRLNTGHFKAFAKKNPYSRAQAPIHDVYNDVSEISEEEKECPFGMPAEEAHDGTLYLEVTDPDFWTDRNRQLQFLVNRPALVSSMGCVNNKVPDFPPFTKAKGTYVFFVNGEEVSFRNLTQDRLGPWSENASKSSSITLKRPKSSKTPLSLNRENQLRVWRLTSVENTTIEYQLHVYQATLPRLPRLRKKIAYVLKQGRQIGYGMIMYSYTEPGPLPKVTEKNMDQVESYLENFPHEIKMEIQHLLKSTSPNEIAKIIFEIHGVVVNPHMLHYCQRQEAKASVLMGEVRFQGEVADSDLTWTNADGAGPSTSTAVDHEDLMVQRQMALNNSAVLMDDMVADGEMVVEHTEIIEPCPLDQPIMRPMTPLEPPHPMDAPPVGRSNFLKNSSSGFIRGHQRYDALWRIAQKSFGTSNGHETFDQLFRLLLEKNEGRLLRMINQAFNVEIYPSEVVIGNEEIVEEIVEEVVDMQGDMTMEVPKIER